MQEDRSVIEDITKRTGTTRDEALVLYHLERAGKVFDTLPNIITGEKIQFAIHHQALINMIAVRVVGRDHPEAWDRAVNPEEL